jgi:translation elongation factor EF-1beta
VDGAIGAEEGEDGRDEADEERRARAVATKGEVGGKDIFGVAMGGKIGESNEDAEEANDVENEDCAFNLRELGCEVGVEEESEEGDSEEKEGSVPSLEAVCWVIENKQALNNRSPEVRGTG